MNIIKQSMFISLFSELMFLETSALTGENVEEAFVQCARKILNKIESGTKIPVPCALTYKLTKTFESRCCVYDLVV